VLTPGDREPDAGEADGQDAEDGGDGESAAHGAGERDQPSRAQRAGGLVLD
jgi:hypothetical protein